MYKIGWIQGPNPDAKSISGGNAYARHLDLLLKNKHSLKNYGMWLTNGSKVIGGLKRFRNMSKVTGSMDVWIHSYDSIIFCNHNNLQGKTLALIHHIDLDYLSYPFLRKIIHKRFLDRIKKVDKIITGSQSWKEYFLMNGCVDVDVIYNPFEDNIYDFTKNEISDFKETYSLSDKPIVYLGNCQRSKGVVENYNALKHLDVHLITSGKKLVNIPARNLNLDYKDYLKLLSASSIVLTMSKFKEGWCRTAHEAMLCKTPVIGSGLGGMEELLCGGHQTICDNVKDLSKMVLDVMENPELAQLGYEFASNEKFSLSYFYKKWENVLRAMGHY